MMRKFAEVTEAQIQSPEWGSSPSNRCFTTILSRNGEGCPQSTLTNHASE